jgi:mxaD protein
MNKAFAVAAMVVMLAPCTASADPPKLLRVTESVTIKAPVDRVWAAIKNFDGLDKWHPGFSKDEIIKGTNNRPGAVRALTIKDGPTLKEELLAYSGAQHSFRYKIIESPLPITGYVSTVSVKAGKDGTTVVRWVGTFKRKNQADNPPAGEDDAAAIKLVTGVYQGGLANLKKMNEG